MKYVKGKSGLRTLTKFAISIFFLLGFFSGCLIDSYESCVKKKYLIIGYQTPPLMATKETAKAILENQKIFIPLAETNGDILNIIAKETSLPIVVKNKTDFLKKSILPQNYSGQTALEILQIMRKQWLIDFSIEEGWVRLEPVKIE